ncbi:unnamed protein product [Bemisia tabaci]|uniref:Uncharacterized protein n=1 Tax=Bemisia tabaci TaxID=7038 RepID=A0A9P0AG90_BEMTA|nr:unnamed protein product [Bemisia tabaci]
MWFTLTVVLSILSLTELPIHFHAEGSAKPQRQESLGIGGRAVNALKKVAKVGKPRKSQSSSRSFNGSVGSFTDDGSQVADDGRWGIDACTHKRQTRLQRCLLLFQRNERSRKIKRNFSRAGSWLGVKLGMENKKEERDKAIRKSGKELENKLVDFLFRDVDDNSLFSAEDNYRRDVRGYLPSVARDPEPDTPDRFQMIVTDEYDFDITDPDAITKFCILRCLKIYGYYFDLYLEDPTVGFITGGGEDLKGRGRIIPITRGIVRFSGEMRNRGGSPRGSPRKFIRKESFEKLRCECEIRNQFIEFVKTCEADGILDQFRELKKTSSQQAVDYLKKNLVLSGIFEWLPHPEVLGLLYLEMRKRQDPFPVGTFPYKIRNAVVTAVGVPDNRWDRDRWFQQGTA